MGTNVILQAAEKGHDRFLAAQHTIVPKIINTQSDKSMTSLHRTAVLGYVHTTKVLLDKGVDPLALNAQD